jgi:hypothetical protein
MLLNARSSAVAALSVAMLGVRFWASCAATAVVNTADSGALNDAATDARRPSRDASDAGIEESDAAFVIDRSWLTGEWDPIPNTSPRCDILMARNPARDVTPISWSPCPSGRAGCSLQNVDWTSLPGDTLLVPSKEPVRPNSEGRAVFLFRRWYPRPTDPLNTEHAMTVVQEIDGRVLFAEALPNTPGTDCTSTADLTNSGWLQTLLHRRDAALNFIKLRYRNTVLSNASLVMEREIDKTAFLGGQYGGGGVNDTHALTFVINPDHWVLVNYTTGQVLDTKLSLDDPRDLPGGFLTRRFGAGLPVLYLRNDGTYENLLTAPPGRTVTGYAVDRTQGNALVWVEATGLAPSTNPVLYTAPYTTSGAALTPRRVTAYDDPSGFGGGYMIAANGIALNVTSPGSVLLTKLTTGESWSVSPEPGMGFADPVWVDDQHFWIMAGTLGPSGALLNGRLYRYERAALGSPLPAR